MEMVWIEPGTFTMGSPADEPGREVDEGPQHSVTITSGFWLGRTELTQAQWQSVMEGGVTGSTAPKANISWNDVQGFIGSLNATEGIAVYRLPTEAEWEYACRAGTNTRWPFGDDESQLGNYAWYGENSGSKAHEVGTKLPNPWGLYDMHGNVYEWCHDWYGDYLSGTQTDPTGPVSGSTRATRGGDMDSPAASLRSASRYENMAPDDRGYWCGVRLLRQAP